MVSGNISPVFATDGPFKRPQQVEAYRRIYLFGPHISFYGPNLSQLRSRGNSGAR